MSDKLEFEPKNAYYWKRVAVKNGLELASLRATNKDLQSHFDALKADYVELVKERDALKQGNAWLLDQEQINKDRMVNTLTELALRNRENAVLVKERAELLEQVPYAYYWTEKNVDGYDTQIICRYPLKTDGKTQLYAKPMLPAIPEGWQAIHIRQYMHNDGSGYVAAYDKAGIDAMIGLAQKGGK